MKRRIPIQLRAGTVTIVIDPENNQVWKEFDLLPLTDPPQKIHMEPYHLDDEWIRELFICKVCGGPMDDEHFAWAFWSLKKDYCSTKCWTEDHGVKNATSR